MVATAMVLVAIQEHVRCVGGCDCQHQMPYDLSGEEVVNQYGTPRPDQR